MHRGRIMTPSRPAGDEERDMDKRATATFEITGWEETAFDEPSEGPKLLRATVRKTFRGEVSGESTAELLMCQAADGSAGYVAMERVVGRVGDRSGGFVIQHGATRDTATSATFGSVVPGSGTDDLRGIRGEATYRHDEHGATFTLDYAIE